MTHQTYYIQKCPICGRRLQVKTKYYGMTLMCRHCQGRFVAKDPASVFDDDTSSEDTRVDNALQNLEDKLEKSGIFSHSSIHGAH